MEKKQIIYVSGLPRSGSTLITQLVGEHPLVSSNTHSSPLAGLLTNIRHTVSDSDFFLAQLDINFEQAYQQLTLANQGFINGWYAPFESDFVVDKNRLWLGMLETLAVLDPDFKMIVCLRDLRQVFGSMEAQHQQTRLIDFPGHPDAFSIFNRAKGFFAPDGVIGGPLQMIGNMQDITDMELRSRLLYLCYESLLRKPQEVMQDIFRWLEPPEYDIDFNNLATQPGESDSYYRMKFPHQTHSALKAPPIHDIPKRIEKMVMTDFEWYYRQFYPSVISAE